MPGETIIRPAPSSRQASPFVGGGTRPEPCTILIFGVTGDLAARKLLPALFGLWRGDHLPKNFAVVGVARRPKGDDDFRKEVREAVVKFRPDARGDVHWDELLGKFYYHQADFGSDEGLISLDGRLPELEGKLGLPGNRLFYLAVDPEFFAPLIEGLGEAGLVHREVDKPWGRVVIEKPFGRDLASARELDRRILRVLRPDQIYRIDHYLGKETVQNVLAFRFGNAIFEPVFNRRYVDHVQITMAETVGMEGRRGAFYEHAGALRDVVQNHVLQLLALVAMDPPASLRASDLSHARLQVLRSLVPISGKAVDRDVVRGQYGPGTVEGKPALGYRQEEGVAPDSAIETFVAIRAEVENWRWAGVPFLLRAGKRLPRRVTEVAVQFRLPPLRLFQTVECEGDFCDLTDAHPSVLTFRIQPDEGISLSFSTKRPGMQMVLQPVRFEFDYKQTFDGQELPEAYERLILDALRGDGTLFTHSEELEAAWEFATPILETWAAGPKPAFPNYDAGTWGPVDANKLMHGCQCSWLQPGG